MVRLVVDSLYSVSVDLAGALNGRRNLSKSYALAVGGLGIVSSVSVSSLRRQRTAGDSDM